MNYLMLALALVSGLILGGYAGWWLRGLGWQAEVGVTASRLLRSWFNLQERRTSVFVPFWLHNAAEARDEGVLDKYVLHAYADGEWYILLAHHPLAPPVAQGVSDTMGEGRAQAYARAAELVWPAERVDAVEE